MKTPWTLPKIGFFALLAVLLITGGLAVVTLITDNAGTPTQAAASADDSQQLTADEYHLIVRDNIPSLADASDRQLDNLADEGCKLLRQTLYPDGWLTFVQLSTKAGMTGYEAGQFGTYVVFRSCPELADRLPSGGAA